MALNKGAVRKATPKAQPYYVWGGGFGIRVFPSGHKTFVASGTDVQRKIRITSLGNVDEMDFYEAKLQAELWRKNIRQHRLPSASFAELFEIWWGKRRETWRPNTVARYRHAKTYIVNSFLWGIPNVDALKKGQFFAFLQETKAATGTKNLIYGLLNGFYRWAVDKGQAEKNPVSGVWDVVPARQRTHVLEMEEICRLWVASKQLAVVERSYVRLLILAGQRRTETATVQEKDLDWRAKTWTIPAEKNKGKRNHVLPLTQPMRELLQPLGETLRPERYVFSKDGERPLSDFGNLKRKLDAISGVQNWRLHDLRRSAATHMVKLGIDPFVVKRVLNHSVAQDLGVTGIYVRDAFLEKKKEALETWQVTLNPEN